MGMNAVRIRYRTSFRRSEAVHRLHRKLDKAFNWAEKYGLKILIDLHTVPDGQNGFDNGGISSVYKWAQEPEEVEFVLTVLERLAGVTGMRPGLWGIELLNEPAMDDLLEKMNVMSATLRGIKRWRKAAGTFREHFFGNSTRMPMNGSGSICRKKSMLSSMMASG